MGIRDDVSNPASFRRRTVETAGYCINGWPLISNQRRASRCCARTFWWLARINIQSKSHPHRIAASHRFLALLRGGTKGPTQTRLWRLQSARIRRPLKADRVGSSKRPC